MSDKSTEQMLTELSQPEREERALTDFRPTSFEQALKFCEYISKSELVPLPFRGKPADIFSAIQYGAEIGLGPMQSLRSIVVINGRPTLWGDTLLAKVQQHPDYEWHDESESTEVCGVCIIKRKGAPAFRSAFSIEDAKRAGLWGKAGPWTQYPARMLKLRARGFALRDKFADAIGTVPMTEEVLDITPEAVPIELPSPEAVVNKGDAVLERMKAQHGEIKDAMKREAEPPVVETGPGPDFPSASQWTDIVTHLWDEPERAALATGVLKDEFKVSKTSALKPEQRAAFLVRCQEVGYQKGVRM